MISAQSASATTQYLIKNVATGKCLEGTDSGTLNAYTVKMVTCNKATGTQHWDASASKVELVRSGGAASQICLSVPTSPSGDIARSVYTAPCGASGYEQTMEYGITSDYPLAPGGGANCYIGHYSSSDTSATCYVNDGSYTRWTWVAA
ncbi:ricin-type beta-trefoil lectin domain protein [Streptomyces sp. SL13]|uniref:Ricin-type beta-trefoil lectin domain protein n=2 Tax=Streptantibioticus silvisoli TaxID=2705255 RepID=A0AA90H590_9ACTN|nr:ricin-type beta-trefoil lectin domain protein [Streptantibioticus silvisoli]MDI5964601.1 ricin-type beta-trefoil lectin domain protein [Streptantibioticus silvisoli]MDI5970894.1 ricin-type beta-trefoil lectin domain protein [Streptantibioticus silvisoli]